MPITSTSHRDHLLNQYVSPEGERESGIRHLWHIEKLARARLGPSRGIQDAPEVDFHDPEYISDEQLRATGFYLDCQERRRQAEARQLYKANSDVLDRLVRATDDEERRRRHMNLFPQGHNELVEMDRIHDQHTQRHRDRLRRQRAIDDENANMLKRLQSATSELPRTAKLNSWHRSTHTPRVRTLSRFRKAEPFAGARVLETECNVRLPSSATTHGAHLIATASAPSARALTVRAPFSAAPSHPGFYETLTDTRLPLLLRQPYPPLTVSDTLPSAPSALQPLHKATHFGRSLRRSPAALLSAAAAQSTRCTAAPHTLREARPAWQSVAATDIPLYYYTKDLELRTDALGTVRRAEQECGCTALWRRGARHRQEAYESQRREEEVAMSTLRAREEAQRASLKEKIRRSSSLQAPRQRSVTPAPQLRAPSGSRAVSSASVGRLMQGEMTSADAEVSGHGVLIAKPTLSTSLLTPTLATAGDGVAAEEQAGGEHVHDEEGLSALLSQWREVLDTHDSAPFAPL